MTTCKFCQDRGCIACPGEQAQAEEKALEPIFTADLNNEHDMELLRDFFGREALESGQVAGLYPNIPFTNTGDEMAARGALASLLQRLHKERTQEDES